MSEREMSQVAVYVGSKGDVCISQNDAPESPAVIFLHPGQVDLLIAWLKDAKAKAEAASEGTQA